MSSVNVLLVDRITPVSLLAAWPIRRSLKTLWVFDPPTRSSARTVAVFRWLGLLRADVRQLSYHMGDVRQADGGNGCVSAHQDASRISAAMTFEPLKDHPLLDAMRAEWAPEKVRRHFQLVAEQEVIIECKRVLMAEWLIRCVLQEPPERCALLVERKPWLAHLDSYARSRRLALMTYRAWSFSWLLRIRQGLRRLGGRTRESRRAKRGSPGAQARAGASIAIQYWYRKLSFEPTERSEFFFLPDSGLRPADVLIYDYVTPAPLDAATANELTTRGIRLFGRGPGIPRWTPTRTMAQVLWRVTAKLSAAAVQSVVRRRPPTLGMMRRLMRLAWDYAYWYDFFAANHVRVNVAALHTTMGQVLALDALNGVSVSYQFSLTLLLPTDEFSTAGEDVQFVFSELFERLWRSSPLPPGRCFPTGFIDDYGIRAIRSRDREDATRARLHAKGVTSILCFFDENTVDRWDFWGRHDDAAKDYEFLLTWLLDDPTLGMVLKPKKSTNLFQRLRRISPLIEQARGTGRCLFLTSETRVGSIFPAEAALVADICIGKLAGGTAAFEARLIGRPTILVDREGFRDHPFHAWGRGDVVFDHWEEVRAAVERYRAAPALWPGFGDWGPVLQELDPFQDGRASIRMGRAICWITEALAQGLPKHDAVERAARRYAQAWGPLRAPAPCSQLPMSAPV